MLNIFGRSSRFYGFCCPVEDFSKQAVLIVKTGSKGLFLLAFVHKTKYM